MKWLWRWPFRAPIAEAREDLDEDALSERAEGASALRPGIQIAGKFTLQRLLAVGAMGTIFEAWDMFLERKVALKLMHPEYAHDAEMIARFRREARAAASIQHPHVVTVLEVGKRRDGSFFIVQELLTGVDLRQYLGEKRRLPLEEALAIMVPAMAGLVAAHRCGIVHRDVKPENIMLTQSTSGELVPKVVDFGVARISGDPGGRKITRVGYLVGTPEYMSPEQTTSSSAVDARTDVWSAALVLLELLCGGNPYSDASPQAVVHKIQCSPAPPVQALLPDVPAPVASVLQRALEPNVDERIQTMQALRDELVAAYGRGPGLLLQSMAPLSAEGARFEADGPGPAGYATPPETRLDELEREAPAGDALQPLSPVAQSDAEWAGEVEAPAAPKHDSDAEAAMHALSVNALGDALRTAEGVLKGAAPDDPAAGHMWLIQAIAHRWLGHYAKAEACADQALGLLPRSSTGWYAALGHLTIACSYLGRTERAEALMSELAAAEAAGVKNEAHLVAACRLVVFLVRAGLVDEAQHALQDANRISRAHRPASAFVEAWFDVARAELSVHAGDLTAYLARVESARDNFTSASDLRNACLQRTNMANAYMQLGAYEQCAAVLREAINIAEPMQLDLVALAKVNLGFALAQLGQLDEALAVESAVLDQLARQGHRRFEGIACTYLSLIKSRKRDPEGALALAKRAASVSRGVPAVEAYALGVLSDLLLGRGETTAAAERAREAKAILDRLGGVEEGESLIQTMFALTLRASGDEAEARRQITEARERLHRRASRIGEARWRKSFLERVFDNDRLVRVARQWLDRE